MTELQKTLARLGVNYDGENFERMNADQITKVVQDPSGHRQHLGNGANKNIIAGLKAEAVGQLSITVTRASANLAWPVPYIIFGQNDFASGYIITLAALLGNTTIVTTATTCAVTTSGGNVLFTFTSAGPIVDVVTVALRGNNNYVSFLSSMAQNFFKFRFVQLSISDENQGVEQFGLPTQFGELSSLGKVASDSVVLSDMIESSAFRKDKAELVVPEQPVTPSYSYASYIVDTANFIYAHGFFMSWRANLNKV